jgi:hypothetical protein
MGVRKQINGAIPACQSLYPDEAMAKLGLRVIWLIGRRDFVG